MHTVHGSSQGEVVRIIHLWQDILSTVWLWTVLNRSMRIFIESLPQRGRGSRREVKSEMFTVLMAVCNMMCSQNNYEPKTRIENPLAFQGGLLRTK